MLNTDLQGDRSKTRGSWMWSFNGLGIDISLAVDRSNPVGRVLSRLNAMPDRFYWRAMIVTAIAMVCVWLRCTTILSHATFWGEDGWVWYPTCYNQGWTCLLVPHSGYLQTESMLTALVSQWFSLINAPNVFAWVALLIQAAPAAFLLSHRMAEAIPSKGIRLVLAALLIAIPGMQEVYVNTTDSQWHLPLLAFLILTAAAPRNTVEKIFDTLVLVISGLSGPFSVFLALPALLWWFYRRTPWNVWRASLVIVTALIQIGVVLAHQASRGSGVPMGATIPTFDTIMMVKIIGVATIGAQTIVTNFWDYGQGWLSSGHPWPVVVATILTLLVIALTVLAFLRGPLILKGFLIFAWSEFAASLLDSLPLPGMTMWHALEITIAYRYAFHPICAWLVVLVACAASGIRPARWIGFALLACTVFVAIPADWYLNPLPKQTYRDFHHDAKVFAKAKPGTTMSFPVRPMNTPMTLVKN
ncbi:hypothetical protein [Acidisoma silvae]|uniref:Uncharacterized protein n=1 Tax=Acidisoma silvae TaxID=2802396 RepID=A0A963YT98_9PROT|nr:hypothetical protein [Acidisoma silvae]MCB8876595.1 hypothetical protein [Acidisoma silvae]